MLTLRECLDFCGLSEEEVQVIAEHEGVPEIAAAAIGSAFLESDQGIDQIKRLLTTEIRTANRNGLSTKAKRLENFLDEFEAPRKQRTKD
jgi:hypothetical protein